ncbi:MAG: hypothetical protein Q4P06_07605 [Actinomycetaceae bacterium]|nr:hypothetical protein [Actinomycetaceae bacterium]
MAQQPGVPGEDFNSSGDTPASSGGTSTWGYIAQFVFTMLQLNFLLLFTLSPILFVVLALANPLQAILGLGLALVLISPGIAAAFATFRDCPTLHTALAGSGRAGMATPAASAAGAIAGSYWSAEDGNAVFKPYFRAYRRLAKRALLVSLPLTVFTVIVIVEMQMLTQVSWATYLVPTLLVLLLLALGAWLPSLVMVVEMPQAKVVPIIRNGVYLALRRWYLTLLNLLTLVALSVGLIMETIIVAVFIMGPVLYFVWANSRWLLMPMVEALENACLDDLPPDQRRRLTRRYGR